ncbi:MAG: preprotein translocase subunit SecE [Elusimicrobia bacterium]|nr:preprotein translocase subunit SecE [Elusimicrobiota bacterium]
MIGKINKFLREVLFEVKKVTWPGRKELVGSTIVVVILVIFVALYIGFIDFVLSRLLSVIIQ